jgi:hypothetical protein
LLVPSVWAAPPASAAPVAGFRDELVASVDQPVVLAWAPDDVGEASWEEVDRGKIGADYGWNRREGTCVTGSTTNCPPPPSWLTDPIFTYGHEAGCSSITGGAFLPRSWPAPYGGSFVYGDWECGKLFLLRPDGHGGFTSSLFASVPGSSPVAVAVGPLRGGGLGLYYTNLSGEVRRIVRS